MLFDAREFEHYFSNTLLKKGLRLFEKGSLEPEGRVGSSEFKFLVEDQFDLMLKKRGDKVMSYTCSCNKPSYCEHLCAALFFFQKDALGISVKKQKAKTQKIQKVREEKSLGFFLKDIEPAALVRFIENYAAGNPLFKETVIAWFSSGSEESAFHFYSVAIRNILAISAASENLQQNNLDEIESAVKNLIATQDKNKTDYKRNYYLSIAILAELPAIFNSRVTGDETGLISLLEETTAGLDLEFSHGLSDVEKTNWKNAAFKFLKNNAAPYAATFSFLVPKAIFLLTTKNECNELKKLLERKNLKLTRATSSLNVLEVARIQLAIKEAELFKTPFPFKKYSQDLELLVAKAEHYFYNGKTDKAFKHLEENYREIKIDFPTRFKVYTDYIICKAAEKKRPEIELHYLAENFVYGPHVSPKELDRFLELIPAKKQAAQVTQLISKIKKQPHAGAIEKVFAILLRTNRLSDLIKELKKQENKFNLVNKVAVQSLPDYNNELLSVYLQHLTNALIEAKYTNYQQPLFLLAKKYFDRLPHKTANEIIARLLKQVEFIKPLYNFIRGYYPHAL